MASKPKAAAKSRSALNPIGGEELGSAAQRDRRKRILDATLALAAKGGYDAVQMRTVAERADVALGTLYRYFPSKIHLLVSGLAREFERAQDKLDRGSIPGDTPTERLLFVLGRNTRMMQRDPHLTEAMVRAFMFADTTAAAEVEQVGLHMENMFAKAMGIDDPTEQDRDVFHVIADVWMANLVAWVTRRASATDVAKRLELSVHLLLD
ncbi:cholesterol catabolism transcriptional regulator KstR [Prauserella cavernicola]|uniref:Cholesterol catabolism transcriptional regulator KstR n=1 Tax=Prauserella cavernicola TaxID=2800127 RepID=A0A934R044_9PSEU|nr:cholesterol catabolism transcriptional regulator KstR [Prauserella cavernicola]MBK1788674.1 cholesterol catabolism transcriptional regulator KstR [Prauserella cavernicola]